MGEKSGKSGLIGSYDQKITQITRGRSKKVKINDIKHNKMAGDCSASSLSESRGELSKSRRKNPKVARMMRASTKFIGL